MCGFYRRWTGNSSNPVLRWHSTNTAMPWWTFFPRRLTAASTCFDRVRIIFPRFQRVDFYEKLDGHCVGYKLNTAAIKNGRIPNSIFSVASTHFSPLSSPLKQKSKFFSLIFSLLWMQMKSRTSDTRISAVWTSKSRKFAKQWSCRWRTLSCTSRSGLTRRVASSSTGLRAAARPCWPKAVAHHTTGTKTHRLLRMWSFSSTLIFAASFIRVVGSEFVQKYLGRGAADGARRVPFGQGKFALHHLHRRDRRHRHEAFRRADRGGSRSPAHLAGTVESDGRIRSKHQRQGNKDQWRLEVRQRGGSRSKKRQWSPLWLRRGRETLSRGKYCPYSARSKFRGRPRPLGPNGPGATDKDPFSSKLFPPDFFPLPNRMKLALVLREIDSSFQVIMATNRADTLDPALLRPGRLDRKIEFPMPDRRQKRLVFATITSGMNLAPEVDLEDYVSRPDKISCADINAICQDVSRLTAIVGLVFRPQMRVGITRKTWPSRNVCRSKYSIVPRCSVTFWTHPEIIPVGQFFRRWIQSINQAQTFIVNLPVDWLIDDKLTLTWLVYWDSYRPICF